MAKKEEETYPAYIDYEGAENPAELNSWTGTDLINFFTRQAVRQRNTSVAITSIKDRTLAKRMVEQYAKDELQLMVIHWMQVALRDSYVNFGAFYKSRHHVNSKIKPKDYGWD